VVSSNALATGIAAAALIWATLTFGGVYPWAYVPVLLASGAVAVCAAVDRRMRRGAADAGPVPHVLFAAALLIALQLLPLPAGVVNAVSPNTVPFLREYSPAFAWTHAGADPQLVPMSVAPMRTWLALAFIVALGLFSWGLSHLITERDASSLVRVIAALGCCVAFVGIVQRAAGTPLIYGFWKPDQESYTNFGPFVNRNHFAGWVVMALPLTLGACFQELARVQRRFKVDWRDVVLQAASPEANRALLLGFCAAIMMLALGMSLSRSGLASGCIAGSMVCAAYARRQPSLARGTFVTMAIVAAAGGVIAWAGTDPIIARFQESRGQDLRYRLGSWGDALGIFARFPAAGTGMNTYGLATLVYPVADPSSHWSSAHNDYLQLLAEGGTLVALPAMVALIALVRRIRRILRESACSSDYWIRLGAVSGLMAIALQSFVDFTLQIPAAAFLCTGLLVLATARYNDPERERC
jgi:O-antigen ligase